MFTIQVTPPEIPAEILEEEKTKLITQARELIVVLNRIDKSKSIDLINLTWGANKPENANTEEYIKKLSAAIADAQKIKADVLKKHKQEELKTLKDHGSFLVRKAKKMRTDLFGIITDEAQTKLLNLRLELETALNADTPISWTIRDKIFALSDFMNPHPLADEENTSEEHPSHEEDSPELKGRRLSR